jgi:hypothetical protein
MPRPSDSHDSYYNNALTPVTGLHVSLLSLRLGTDRSYELTLWHSLQSDIDADMSFRTGLCLTRVWP